MITSIKRNKYYTTDKKLADMRNKFIDWDNLQGLPILIFLSSFIFIIIPACYVENDKVFPWWCWLLLGIGIAIILGSITFGCILSKKINEYSEYEDLFFKTKEYTTQYNRYKRIEKEQREQKAKEKAKDLIESYDILDDKEMPKDDKIELLKKYIYKSENE